MKGVGNNGSVAVDDSEGEGGSTSNAILGAEARYQKARKQLYYSLKGPVLSSGALALLEILC